MARKQYPYNAKTTERFRQMGRYYDKTEYLNPFHIIKERNDLRLFRHSVSDFCDIALRTDDLELLRKWIYVLKERTQILTNNTYFAGEKHDLFGFADYICLDANEGIVAVQLCNPSRWSEHKKKILRNVNAQRWVCHDKIELWTWRPLAGKRGRQARVEEITLDMFKEFANADCCR